ncbi:MAG: TSUP family transporter [Dehalococcoidia bacterium]|nr:TSUP family transporter [Dehalococcoidia bacterium]
MIIGTGLALGLVAGIFSGILGIGGGTIIIPGLVLLLGVEQHTAQGVSLAAMLIAAVSGSIVQYRQNNLDLRLASFVAPAAAAFAFLGAYLAGLVAPFWLSRAFALLLFIIGIAMLISGRGGPKANANTV